MTWPKCDFWLFEGPTNGVAVCFDQGTIRELRRYALDRSDHVFGCS